jgi:phage-related protein
MGAEPVRDWLKGLEKKVRVAVGSEIERVQWNWPVSKPLVDGLGQGLYEVRTSCAGSIYRVFFSCVAGEMILLHGFQKKTQKTPQAEIYLARARQGELRAGRMARGPRQGGKSP